MFYRILFSKIEALTVVFDTKSTELFFSYNDSMDRFEVKLPQLIISGNLFNRYNFFPLFCTYWQRFSPFS